MPGGPKEKVDIDGYGTLLPRVNSKQLKLEFTHFSVLTPSHCQ